MTEKKIIKFTTKQKGKPQGNFVSMVLDPIFVEIEETDFPTKKGDRKVSSICFFPSDSISQGDIKKTLQMSGGEVKKLTFEIEIDGGKIEADEPPQNNFSSHSASHSASGGNFAASSDSKPEPKNDWKNETLNLRNFKLEDIKVKTETNGTDEQQQNSGTQNTEEKKGSNNTKTPPTSNTGQQNQTGTNKRDTEKPPKNNNNNSNGNDKPTPEPAPQKPTQEEINKNREDLKQSTLEDDKEKLADSIKKNEEIKDKGVSQSSADKAAEEAARKKLAEDKEKYRTTIYQATKAKLETNGVKKDELGSEAKNKLEKLENGEINEPNQVDEAEKIIVKDTYEKATEKKLTNLEREVNEAIKSKSKQKMEETKEKLTQLINNSNYYSKKSLAEALQKKLESALKQNTSTDKSGDIPWKIVVPVALAVVAFLVGLIIYARKRRISNS